MHSQSYVACLTFVVYPSSVQAAYRGHATNLRSPSGLTSIERAIHFEPSKEMIPMHSITVMSRVRQRCVSEM